MVRQTTKEERELIISLFQKGNSQRKIAQIINRSASTVQHIIERYTKEGRIRDKPRNKGRRKLNDKDERWIVRQIQVNPHKSVPEITNDLNDSLGKEVHPQTVRRVLWRADYKGRLARKKPFISKKNKQRDYCLLELTLLRDMNSGKMLFLRTRQKLI